MPGRIPSLVLATGLIGGCAPSCEPEGAPDDPSRGAAGSTAATVTASSLPSWGPIPAFERPELTEAEMRRDPGAPILREASDGRTAWALGRIGGVAARDRLQAALEGAEPDPAVVGAIAFLEPPASVPGESPEPERGWAALEDALWTRYAVASSPAISEALLLAVARVGGRNSMARLAADTAVLPGAAGKDRYRAALEAMGILCARGFGLDRAALESVAVGLSGDDDLVQAAAAYALARCAAPSAEQIAGKERARLAELLVVPSTSSDPETARLAWKAFAGLGEVPSAVDPSILGESPPPWLVEVEAVQALVGHADGREVVTQRLARLEGAALTGTRVHVVLAALRGLRDAVSGNTELAARLQALSTRVGEGRANAKPRRAKELALVACELAVSFATLDGQLDPVDRCADGVVGVPTWYGSALGVEVLLRAGAALSRQDKVDALLARARDPRPQVAAVALAGLADVDDPRIAPVLRAALGSEDIGMAAAAAAAIAGRAVDASRRDPEVAPLLEQAVGRFDNATRVEARRAAVEALGSLARSATKPEEVEAAAQWLERTVLPLARDPNAAIRSVARGALLGHEELVARFDATDPPSLEVHPEIAAAWSERHEIPDGFTVTTDAGAFVIDLRDAPAPLMQAVVHRLVGQRFYDGLTLHRVVPGFVVQGGDPHGDGYGGPGFVVPCEWSTLRYERGTVGIALAGKDTGGSQLFIAQTPQPHLDGRFTVIGRVVEGIDAVDAILPHDTIVSVSPWIAP